MPVDPRPLSPPLVEPLAAGDAEALLKRGIPVPPWWGSQPADFPDGPRFVLPCRNPRWRSPMGQGPATPMARRDTNGLFHPWLPPRERRSPSLRQCRVCRPRRSEWLDDRVVHPSVVPLRERCPAYRLDWPPHVERPVTGLLPEQRTNRNGRVPRWFVWWKLYELQDQRCAVCDWAPQVIDHDHESLLVRGLLCRDCNAREASSLAGTRVCVHAPPYCFEEYRASPPGEAFAWFWPATSGPPPSFLLLPL